MYMDSIREIFAAIDGTLPEEPFRSFTGTLPDGRISAVAAGRLEDGYYVAYLEEDAPEASEAPREAFVGELLSLHQGTGEEDEGRLCARYLEAFSDGFSAGARCHFFWEAMHPTPAEDGSDDELERDRRRGFARIEDFIRRRVNQALADEILAAEERLQKLRAGCEEATFWEAARAHALAGLEGRISDPRELEQYLRLHRFRRAAIEADTDTKGS